MEWPRVELGTVADIRGGATPSRDNPAYWGGDIPWLTPTDLPANGSGIASVVATREYISKEGLASCSASILPPGTVLFSSRASIGKVGIAQVPLTTNQGFANLIPRPAVDSRYLAWCLGFHAAEIARLAGSTTFKEVSKSALRRFRIPLPPLSEQRRIVEILDQADRLRRLRAEADAKADRILPALFIRMFGDPATNPMGWPERKIGEVCQVVSGATPETNRPEFWGGGIPWATPKDLSGLDDWVLDTTERTITEEGLASCSATMMPKEAVLLSSRAPIGLVALAGVPVCTNQGFKSLVCAGEVDPWYLFAWCKLRAPFLQSLGRGATFKEVSKRIVEEVRIALPPIPEQRKLRDRLEKVRLIRQSGRGTRGQVTGLFHQLMALAFSGSLTASWREAHMRELLQEMEQQAKVLEATKA
jgi:type I restriction enzyme S subunit